MLGEISGLVCAFFWSVSTVMLRAESEKIDVLSLNALRLIPSSVMFLVMVVLFGRWDDLAGISAIEAFFLISSVIIGLGIGDTALFRSMYLLGVSRAIPISNAYPLFTLLFAIVFLGEQLTFISGLGTFLIVLGVSIIATSGRWVQPDIPEVNIKSKTVGVVLAFVAALSWAISTIILKLGVNDVDIIAANSIRMPVAALLMLFLAHRKGNLKVRVYGPKSLLNVAIAGVLGTGLGGLAFLLAVQLAGAAKAAAITSSAPLFAVPLSVLFLKEQITLGVIAGTILTVIGVWLLF